MLLIGTAARVDVTGPLEDIYLQRRVHRLLQVMTMLLLLPKMPDWPDIALDMLSVWFAHMATALVVPVCKVTGKPLVHSESGHDVTSCSNGCNLAAPDRLTYSL